MDEEHYEEFKDELNLYLMKRFNYKTTPIKYARFNTLNAKRAAFDIYLRLPPVPHKISEQTLVIARISFRKKRAGHGRSLFEFLVQQATKHNYDYIAIEQTNKNSSEFAKKLGFEKIDEKNWVIGLAGLSDRSSGAGSTQKY